MFFKKKGQGALEYLLLIGGAVLIAVIVIALLVGMGGQSRETAQDQATKAQQALEQPQPATIVAVEALTTLSTPPATGNCVDEGTGEFKIDWQKLGQGGVYTLKVYDYHNTSKTLTAVTGASNSGGKLILDSATSSAVVRVALDSDFQCEDTYWAEIETEKNGQTVKSTRMKFNW